MKVKQKPSNYQHRLSFSTMPPNDQMALAKAIISTFRKEIDAQNYDVGIVFLQKNFVLLTENDAQRYVQNNTVKMLADIGNSLSQHANNTKDEKSKIITLKSSGAAFKLAIRYYADLDNFAFGAICHLNLLLIYDQLIQICPKEDSARYREILLDEATPVLRYFTGVNDIAKKDKIHQLIEKYSDKTEHKIPIGVDFKAALAEGRKLINRCQVDRTAVSTKELLECKKSLERAIDSVDNANSEDLQSCCYQLIKINYTLAYRLDSKENGYGYLNMALALMRYVDFGQGDRVAKLYHATCSYMCGQVFFQRNNNHDLARAHFANAYPILRQYKMHWQAKEIKQQFPDIELIVEQETICLNSQ